MNKLHANRVFIEPDSCVAANGNGTVEPSDDHTVERSISVEVYRGDEYLGKKAFNQNHIIIGKSLEADLVLSDNEMADKQACITFIDEQPVILDQTQKAGLLFNGTFCGVATIGASQQVGIGPYILNINYHKQEADAVESGPADSLEAAIADVEHSKKNERPLVDLFALFEGDSVEDHDLYDLVFEGNIREGLDIKKVKSNLAKLLKIGVSRVEHFLTRKRVVIKSGLKLDTAKKYKKVFEKSGAMCRLMAHKSIKSDEPSIQNKKPGKPAANISKQSSAKIADRVQKDVFKEKPDSDSDYKIENDRKVSNDDEMISPAHHSKTEKYPDIQLQAVEKVTVMEEAIDPPAEESQSGDDDMINQDRHSDRSMSHDIHAKTAEEALIPKKEQIVSSIKETESIDEAKRADSFRTEKKPVWKFYGVDVDDEDEDEEEDLPANFYLKDKIDDLNESGSHQSPYNGKYLEVLKFRGDDVIDIHHLDEKDKFYILDNRDKRFCLAHFKGVNEALFSFNEKLQGKVETQGKQPVGTNRLMKAENCISKRKKIYRTRIPGKGKVLISDGYFDYQMRIVNQSLVPQAPEIKEVNKKSYKHFGVSFAFHIVFLLFLGLFPSFDNGENNEDESRFVTLDSNQLAELEKVTTPQIKPKPKPKPPEPAPVVEPKLKKQDKPKLVKKQPVRVASKKKPSKVKKTSRPSSRHPDAGGGFGDGNVATRNINETGILGMISDSVGIQPKNALASVTNLDAVSSPNVTASNLTVGGVVGKLGTGEIAVPKGSIISTKGSSQVLRSYGRKGEGRVAALEKGKTGEQEVMGMVTAKIDKSVRIRGGLSMEAVKRVIDAHLDDITYCYETELISNPSIVGKVMFEWKIMLSGEVGEVRIKSSSINSHEIHACIKEAIRTWRFPKPSGSSEVIVSYPFVFDIVGF